MNLKLRVEIENGTRVFLESVGALCYKLDVEQVYSNGLGVHKLLITSKRSSVDKI